VGPDHLSGGVIVAITQLEEGVDDQRALRKDYDDERRRVDKLTDALVGIAQKATGA